MRFLPLVSGTGRRGEECPEPDGLVGCDGWDACDISATLQRTLRRSKVRWGGIAGENRLLL